MPPWESCMLFHVSEVRWGFSGDVTYFILWRSVANLQKFYTILYFSTVIQDRLLICKRVSCTLRLILFTSSSTILRRRSAATALRIEIRSFPTRILRQADAAKSGFKIYCLATLITFLFLGKHPCLCRRKTSDQRKSTKFNTSLLNLVLNFVNVI